jgi:hypothetical protein
MPDAIFAHHSPARQARIDDLMEKVHLGTDWTITDKARAGAIIGHDLGTNEHRYRI